eukprot:c20547_g1_i1 orf=179-1771(+)
MAPSLQLPIWVLSILLFITFIFSPKLALAVDDDSEDYDLELEDLEQGLEDSSPASAQTVSSIGQAQKQGALLDLTDQSAERVIHSHGHVLLLGYASWCTRSSALMPEFAAAAVALRERGSSVLLAKLDGVVHQRAASRYGIKGFPTLLFFTDGKDEPYTGGFTRDEILIWIRKRTGFPATIVLSEAEAKEILKRNLTVAVGYFEKFEGFAYDEFISAAKFEGEIEFLQIDDGEIAKLFSSEILKSLPSMCILKSEPELYVSYEGNFERESILWFVEINKHPLVTRLNQQNFGKLYSSPVKQQVTLFADAWNSELFLPIFQDVAKQFKGQILFLMADTADEELTRPILTMYGLEPNRPIVTAFNNNNGYKFLLEKEITKSHLTEFCSQLLTGDIQQHFKSESIPTEKQGIVHTVVGKTFEAVVLDDSKDVFLEVYTPWCVKCNGVSKVVEKLGKTFKDVESLVIAKIDAAANEHPLIQSFDYPSLVLYAAGNKSSPVFAPKKWTVRALVKFIHDHVTIPIIFPGSTEKDEL